MAECACPNCQCPGLTPREREVCNFLASGLPQRAVAESLSVTVATVKFHERKIRSKIGASTRIVAATRLRSLGFGEKD